MPREASIFCAAGMLRSDLKHHSGAQSHQAYSTSCRSSRSSRRCLQQVNEMMGASFTRCWRAKASRRTGSRFDCSARSAIQRAISRGDRSTCRKAVLRDADLEAIRRTVSRDAQPPLRLRPGRGAHAQVELINIRLVAIGIVSTSRSWRREPPRTRLDASGRTQGHTSDLSAGRRQASREVPRLRRRRAAVTATKSQGPAVDRNRQHDHRRCTDGFDACRGRTSALACSPRTASHDHAVTDRDMSCNRSECWHPCCSDV